MRKLPEIQWRKINGSDTCKPRLMDDVIFFLGAFIAIVIAAIILASAGVESSDIHNLFWLGVIL